MIYTNYRIMLGQIQWIERFNKGENIFGPATAPRQRRLPTEAEKRAFEAEMKSITPVKKRPVRRGRK